MRKSLVLAILTTIASLCLVPGVSQAQKKVNPGGPVIADFSLPGDEEGKKDGIVQLEDLPPDVPVSEFVEGTPQSEKQYLYEKPTMKILSNMYWALGFADLENDEHIDHYLRLTECTIYRKFVSSEFEMKEIRDATRKFIVDNRKEFPTRVELVQELSLRDYDMKRRAFKIEPRYQIQSVRRFELVTKDDYFNGFCGAKGAAANNIFPLGLVLEFSRPFTMTYVPAPPEIALEYIDSKDKLFQKVMDKAKNIEKVYDYRTAYLVMYAKAFAFRRVERSNSVRGASLLQTMAVLEGIEVYGDAGRKQLFYSKSYLSNRSPTEVSENLRKEYEVLKVKYEGEGLFH